MFYTYRQNNPGGSFVQNDRVGQYVIIEADGHNEADDRAENVGIYFDGCDNGSDCSCCGDRWYRGGDESEMPTIYGQAIEEYVDAQTWSPLEKHMIVHIYYKDGRHEKIDIDMAKAVKKNKARERSQAKKLWAMRFAGTYGLYGNKPVRVYEVKSLHQFYDSGGNFGIEREGLAVEPIYGTVSYASGNKTDVEAFMAGVALALQAAKQAAHSAILSHNCDKGPMRDGMEVVVNHLARMLHEES